MDIDNGTNSRKLAFLMQYIDDHANDGRFLRIAMQKNTPEEVAKTRGYFDMTKDNRYYKMLDMNTILQMLKNIQ